MTEPVTNTSTWWVTSASRKGSSHGEDAPNQDAVQFASVKDGSGADVYVAAVSDGHGGRRYVRSDVGSGLAVSVAVTHLAEILRQTTDGVSFEDLLRAEVPAIVRGWREAVLAHLQANPFAEAEVERAGTRLDAEPLVAYGATLLLVIVGEAGVGLAQVGDGDALIRTHGFATRPVPGDPRLVAGETTSLCLDSAESDFRYAALPGSADPDLVLLASDGYANSFADKDWWRAVVGDLAWFLEDRGYDDFAEQFPEWLGESAKVGGDDVTAVVIARLPLVVPPSAVPPAVVAPEAPAEATILNPLAPGTVSPSPAYPEMDAGDATPDGPPPEAVEPVPGKRRRRRTLLLLAIALVLAVGVGVAWWVTAGPGGGSQTPPTQSPGHTTPSGHGKKHHRGGGNGDHQTDPGGNPVGPHGSDGNPKPKGKSHQSSSAHSKVHSKVQPNTGKP